jgi:class 3 adenylate cyclase
LRDANGNPRSDEWVKDDIDGFIGDYGYATMAPHRVCTIATSSTTMVVDAVRCAIEVQSGLAERNAGLPPEKRIEYRVSIHLGDAVEESDGDLMGEGVNIGARLEGVAKPGTICLSEDAYRQVKQRLDLKVTDLGATQLKNIVEPIHVYSLEVGQPAAAKPVRRGEPSAPQGKPRRLALRWPSVVAALAVIVLAAGAYAWHRGFASRLLGTSARLWPTRVRPSM